MLGKALEALKDVRFMPFWLDNPARPTPEPALEEDFKTDLVIVGGGFTGLWAAIIAKETNPDRNICLIEAKEVAGGASGRPGGIMSTSVMHGLSNAAHYYPDELDVLERLGKENIKAFRSAIQKYDIDCEDEWGGELTVSVGDGGLGVLEHEASLHIPYGDETHLLNKQEIQAEINAPIFHGGFWLKGDCGTVNPAKLIWGLKRAVLKLGVNIFENTPLLKINKKPDGLIIDTPKAAISAQKILLATNAFASGHKSIKNRVTAIRDRIIATEPLTDEQMDRVGWKNRQGIYDTRTQLNYMRLTKDNRIIFGGKLAYYFNDNTDPEGDKKADPYIGLAEAFFKTFPCLDDISFSHAWSGPIGLTTRKAVHFQHFYGGDVIYVGGYSGFGVTASRFGARIALKILDKVDFPEKNLTFVKTIPKYIPPEPFRWIGAQITMYALDTMDEKGGWRKLWIKMVEKMGFPLTIS